MKGLLALLLALCLVAEASAQMGGKRGRRGGQDGAPKVSQREAADLFQVTLEELRVDLKLTPEQGPLWDAYARKVEALKSDIARQRSRERTATTPGDAPHELDRLADTQRDRLAAVEEIAEAGKALYRALGQEQKAIADARLAKIVATASAEPAGRGALPAAK